MNQKRIRSINWDEEEKQIFRSVLKEYSQIIENKSLDTNSNKIKIKAWEEVHRKFNELNGRKRELSQLKVQWKAMKVNARKTYSTFKKDANKTGGGTRPNPPDDAVLEIKDLLNPAELLRDQNIYDSDGIIPCIEHHKNVLTTTSEASAITLQDSEPITYLVTPFETSHVKQNLTIESQQINNMSCITIEDFDAQLVAEGTPLLSSQDNPLTTPIKTNTSAQVKVPKRKLICNNISESVLKTRKKQLSNDYVNSILSHSKMLKDEHHMRSMEMAEEEHAIKIQILKENLKCAILEREILEIKKRNCTDQ